MIRKKQPSSQENSATSVTQDAEESMNQEDHMNQEKYDFKVTFKVKIGEKVLEADLDRSLHIPMIDKLNPTIISNMMAEIPSLHARWNFFFNEAVYEYDMMKTKLEVWIAKKSQAYRKQLSQDGKVTEKMIDDMIKADPEFERINDDLSLAKKNMKHVLAQANGFGDKGEKLINIASLIKWEGENLIGGKGASRQQQQYPHVKKKAEYVSDPNQNDGWPVKAE